MSTLTITTFVGATLAVAILTYIFVRRMQTSDNPTEEYFTGGRALAWPVVAGSLLLTNLSTEQLVGLNGAVFKDGNLVGVAWEALAAFAMIATALLFLPRYLASGFTTTPAFLEKRFDRLTRQLVSALFLFGYVTVLLPVVLYTGSLAIKTMFGLDIALWNIVVGIGVLGSWYAIFGGLKSVAVSDTFNGIGLLIGGLAIPILALATLGDGSVLEGVSTLIADKPESLAVLASTDKSGDMASVPWDTLLTGMMFIQIFYWSTNQVIVQRAMGAKNLAEGQKGVLFASLMKLVGPVMLCLPGIIALHMMGDLFVTLDLDALKAALASAKDAPAAAIAAGQEFLSSGTTRVTLEQAEGLKTLGLAFNDQVYPSVVRHVLPDWSLGLFVAVLVGSILSSFNSALNSASTLFCLEFYEGRIPPVAAEKNPTTDDDTTSTGMEARATGMTPFAGSKDPNDEDAFEARDWSRFRTEKERSEHIVTVGKRFGMGLAVASMILAPMLAQMDSIFAYLQKVNGLYSVPIISIFLVGLLTKKAPATSAKAAMVVGIVSYGYFTFFPVEGLHWLHAYFICFCAAILTMVVGAVAAPKTEAEISESDELPEAPVDLTPWAHAKSASVGIVILTILMYVGLQALAA